MTEPDELRDRWRSALEWFEAQPMGRRKVELLAIIRPLYARVREAGDLDALHRMYLDPADEAEALRLSEEAYPENRHLWDLSRTRDVAYGRRLAELEAGRGS